MKKKRSLSVVILVASLLLAVTLMDTWILYTQTHSQTRQSGAYQLESMSGKLESTISEAEKLTMALAIKAREYLGDKESLETFIYDEKDEILTKDIGAFNLYIAGDGFCIIPDFDIPDDYVASDRVWYTGAIRNDGQTYVSSPYQDAMTGDICYSVSVMLGDGETVLGVDYTMESIQNYIVQMSDEAINAVIVTDEGVIAGCHEQELIGEKLVDVIPDNAGIYNSAKANDNVVTGRVRDGWFFENLFAANSAGGWIFIVSISDWELYKNSYIQLFVTILLSLALFSIIIVLYMGTIQSREKAEKALQSREEFLSHITGELAEPLKGILNHSDREYMGHSEDYEEEMAYIHSAAIRLSDMLSQIISYKSIVMAGEKEEEGDVPKRGTGGLNKRFRTLILAVMLVVMFISMYTNISSAYRFGTMRMKSVADEYAYHLSEWINSQKSILDMFVSEVSTDPDKLSDYEGTVAWLSDITRQYPEISVTYMTNPELEHTVYMSNGWEPDEDWHVEERQWYIDTLSAKEGWSVSAPYYDEQTGGYCVTISKVVYDAQTGEFLGIFGIDFFMEKLIDILGGSYSEDGYAFLVDPEGEIINHPYGAYQMSRDNVTNIGGLQYGEIRPDGQTTTLFKDYDGGYKTLIAVRNKESSFSVYAVSDVWKIYGRVIIYGIICAFAFIFCMVLVYRLLTDLIRWQEKTNRELRESANAAISAGKSKSSFLAQMSHEIRTPINAVLGMNEMILRESEDDEIKGYAANIQSAGRTLLSLINSILDFSKIEDGKMELVPVKYDVSSMINDLVNSISERAKSKGLEFVLNVDSTMPCELFGDDVRIRQVIMNLLTNAVKYTEKGKVTLTFSGKRVKEGKYLLRISVRDTGIGIRNEDMEKLFESFARLDEKRNRNIEGTGLGMSIVTRLLALMGSELKVESEYEKGSDFSFELMQDIINEEPIGDFTERLKKSTEKNGDERFLFTHEAKILVVDDNDTNRKVARSLMKRNGIIPDEAASGIETLEMMKKKQYDIVFLDHMMPGMDGVETLKQLKGKNLIPQGCIVIALTANAVSGARERYLESGFDDYLTKPIEVVQLEKKLATWLPDEKVEWRTLKDSDVNAAATSEPEDQKTSPSGEQTDSPEEILEFDAYSDDPAEIPEFEPDEESDANEDPGSRIVGKLKEELGIDTEAALSFCAGEFDLYKEILDDYVRACKARKGELDACYNNADWHEFEVKVHALKSTSKTIGAIELYKRALYLEEAAEKKDEDYIRENYPAFAQDYQELAETISKVMRL